MLGLSPGLYRALNPYIQVLKPISPLAWMPLFLYTIKDSTQSAIMVIFMSSLWPILANTAFGVAGIKRDYLNVSALLAAFVVQTVVEGRAACCRAGDRRGPEDLHRQRMGRNRCRGNADRWNRHRLFRLERVEQSPAHQRDLCDPDDRIRRPPVGFWLR